ncbi:MAG TPA: isocitrate lyase/phosphoenolpyruvate mutase family protein [Rhodoblastus sp.]|nr:isocitrate lyase/phosphoenolpyruvate mutase family protein [Rhodoblastus sp.]
MKTTEQKRAAFRALHAQGCFALPNPWDVGSARMLQHLGFEALASTSAGFAWTAGRPDYKVSRAAALAHLALLCGAVDLPVNADFESGFAATPEGVAESVRLAIEAGVAGLSIEDRDLERGGLYDTPAAIERLQAARAAIAASAADVILVARTEILLDDPSAVQRAIDSLVAFAEAGADCLYAPGVRQRADIEAMARAVAPKPLNVLAIDPTMTLAELAGLGVRRISVGGSLARVGWAATVAAAKEIRDGSFASLAKGMPSKELNGVFAVFPE